MLTVDGITVYHTGDTGLTPDGILPTLDRPVDVMIAPINGAFGNLDARQACELAALVRPRMLIGCHVGMFVEQGGDPALFLTLAARELPEIQSLVMAPGDCLRYAAATREVAP